MDKDFLKGYTEPYIQKSNEKAVHLCFMILNQ